jgi:hypothetical protein
VDDESGWHQVLVEGWGDLVRAAVCDRLDDAFATCRGVLALAVTDPDGAPADAVERVHDGVVVAIAAETGANLDELGSQAAWATYDDTWAELGRRWADGGPMESVAHTDEDGLARLLAGLPRTAIEHAGAVVDVDTVRLVQTDDGPVLDVDGLFRWLAMDHEAPDAVRERARRVVATARRRD